MLISPYGLKLVDLLVPPEERDRAKEQAGRLPSVQISERSVCDLELLATGAFSPLDRFMGQDDYRRVLEEMRLADGTIFPIPITLPVEQGTPLRLDQEIVLRDARNSILAVLTVAEIYCWNPEEEARQVFGTTDPRHPLVAEMQRWGKLYVSGPLRMLELPRRYDFADLRLTPREVRRRLQQRGRPEVVAFQTRNPLHRVHEELTRRAAEAVNGTLLLHPVVGLTKPGDVDYFTRVRTYKVLANRYYSPDCLVLSLLPLAMRMAGPREAVWHALIRRNFGANRLIVGRDHASPGVDSQGRPFYPPYQAQELVRQLEPEVGVRVIPFRELVYLPSEDRFEEISRVAPGVATVPVSGTVTRRQFLEDGQDAPPWLVRPEVARILLDSSPPRHKHGCCVWFTGLSGSGKSTTAEILTTLLLERGRQVTVLDGDVVRTHLSKGLGFSKEDRDINIRRIGFVAAEIVRHGGTVISAAVSPYRLTRNDVRNMVGADRFVEVYMNTPLEVCEQRDTKGMYAQARRGEIQGFTGIDDPYEPPEHPEIVLDTISRKPEENALRIIHFLTDKGFLQPA